MRSNNNGSEMFSMTINNPKLFCAGIWDYGFLDQCFKGTRIKFTDIDGIVEHNGHFLVLETKQPGVMVPSGQRLMFERMHQTGLFTVATVWGQKNATEEMQVLYPSALDVPARIKVANNEDLQNVVSWWYHYARQFK